LVTLVGELAGTVKRIWITGNEEPPPTTELSVQVTVVVPEQDHPEVAPKPEAE